MKNKKLWIFIGMIVLILILNHIFGWSSYLGNTEKMCIRDRDHTIALIQKSHEGDDEARAQIVEENTGLVWCIVRRFAGRGTEMEDLFQIGTIGPISYTHLEIYSKLVPEEESLMMSDWPVYRCV